MKAVVMRQFGGPEVLGVEEVETPRIGPRDVLLKVGACGVCYLDTIVRSGLRSRAKLPLVLGHEIAGEVAEVGAEVAGLSPGDRVTSMVRETCGSCAYCRDGRETLCETTSGTFGIVEDGGYAEFMKVPARALTKLPPEIPFEHAAIFTCVLGTALHAIRNKGQVKPGDTVLVTGAGGGLGIHSIQIARLCGGRVIAVTTSESKADAIREAGADQVVVARDPDFSKEVKRLAGGKGVDVVIENVGSAVFPGSFRSLRPGGRMVFIGELTGTPVPLNPALLILKELHLVGSENATWTELREVVELVRAGRLRPVVSQVLPLEAAADAHRMLLERKSRGRLVLRPN